MGDNWTVKVRYSLSDEQKMIKGYACPAVSTQEVILFLLDLYYLYIVEINAFAALEFS